MVLAIFQRLHNSIRERQRRGSADYSGEPRNASADQVASQASPLNAEDSQAQDHGNDNVVPEDTHSSDPKLWTPFCIRRVSLCIFVGIWIVFLAGLVATDAYDKRDNGLVETQSRYHLAWTYGPTAGK